MLRPLVSCCLSAVGLGLLGHPAPAGELSLPYGRPTGHHVTGPQRGCRVAHEQDATGQGALFIPGTVVRSRPAITFRPAPAALPRPVPTAPLDHPIGGGHFHETSTRVHAIHPSPQARLATGPRPGTPPTGSRRSSPRPRPLDGTRAASASTRASHPAVTRDARRGGDRPSRTGLGTTPSTSAEPPNGASHLTQAPSRRT